MKNVTYTVPPRPDSNASGTKQNGNKPSDKKPRRAEVGTSTCEQLYNGTFCVKIWLCPIMSSSRKCELIVSCLNNNCPSD